MTSESAGGGDSELKFDPALARWAVGLVFLAGLTYANFSAGIKAGEATSAKVDNHARRLSEMEVRLAVLEARLSDIKSGVDTLLERTKKR